MMAEQAGSSHSHGRSSPEPVYSASISGSESHRSRSTSAATDANSLAALEPDTMQKPSEAAFAKARATRPEVCGSYAPERPYPIYLRGVVERGFGRGGKDLGCPTANLPSKIFQTQSQLQRTGIYFGFARVLPQDPDDPDLLPEGVEGDADAEDVAGASAGIDDENGLDYDDDDDDEVILSASPIHEPEDIADPARWRDSGSGTDLQYLVKPRQMSRSSARSSRSVGTILEKAAQLDLDRSFSAQSAQVSSTNQARDASTVAASTVGTGPASTARANGLAIVADAPENSSGGRRPQPEVSALAPAPAIVQKTGQIPSSTIPTGEAFTPLDASPPTRSADKHPREQSGSSSKTNSLRRKKKRRIPITSQDARVYPMVMSVGWNPFYNNTSKTAEVHIMHKFSSDFYGLEMRVVVLGYIRPEYNYVSKEALIADIDMDKRVSINSLARTPYQDYVTDPFLMAPS